MRPFPRAAALLVVAASLGAPHAGTAQETGWRADPDLVRRSSERMPGINFDESRVPAYRLPDAMTAHGARVGNVAAWRHRRAEILELFRKNVYGRSPGRPERLRFDVVQADPRAMNGAATLRRVAIVSGQGGREHRFVLSILVPNARRGRVPLFLLLNNRTPDVADPTRRERSGFWPAEDVIARGYGIAVIQVGDLAPDDSARFRDGVIRLFEPDTSAPRAGDAWGALGAWAWGASRAMDWFERDPRVDARRVAVIGHSRGGKAALWAGAQDERFALVISNESGEGGAALSRRWFGETVDRITKVFPHWFAPNYRTFACREAALPTDQHMLLDLIAPRALYVASADEDLWSDPRGEFLALAATSPVYALYGEPPIRPQDMPPLEHPLVVGRRAYHIRRGTHDLTPYDWARYMDFADRLWR